MNFDLSYITYLYQFCEVLEVLVVVYRQLVLLVDDTVVLHLLEEGDAEGVVPGVVGGLPHQEQAVLPGVE